MREYRADEFRTFLLALDKEIAEPRELRLMGGAAMALMYDGKRQSQDIDVFESEVDGLEEAIARARDKTGLSIPFEQVTVAQPPEDFEDRLREVPIEGLRNLRVVAADPYDLAYMKAQRAVQKDLEDAQTLAKNKHITVERLVDRYTEAAPFYTGDRNLLRLKFLTVVGTAFGKSDERRVRELLAGAQHAADLRNAKRRHEEAKSELEAYEKHYPELTERSYPGTEIERLRTEERKARERVLQLANRPKTHTRTR